jgi:hypothetical protein
MKTEASNRTKENSSLKFQNPYALKDNFNNQTSFYNAGCQRSLVRWKSLLRKTLLSKSEKNMS